jgi:hypothetical protein
MQAQKEKWQLLCEQIAVEQDPTRFMQLVHELNKLLEEKERRLNQQREPDRAVGNTAP